MRSFRLSLTFLAVLTAVLIPAGSAGAKTFTVTSTGDSPVGATLRAAIEAANVNADDDTIDIQATGTIGLLGPLPPLEHELEILGPGAGSLTVSRAASADFRIFHVGSGAKVEVADLTIANGRSPGGGGIFSQGPLTLRRVVVRDNEAVGSGGVEARAVGGGIYALAPLTVLESSIRGNKAKASGGTSSTLAQYGGLFANEEASIVASTISGNSVEAVSGPNVTAEGGGMTLLSGPATVERSTISGNSVTAANGTNLTVAEAGGLSNFDNLTLSGVTVTANSVTSTKTAAAANLKLPLDTLIRSTIVSAPQGASSCKGTSISGGFNIEDGFGCGFGEATDRDGTDPGLDPVLRDNGGPTPTHALLPASVAIDRGSAFGATTDQRGLPRPLDFAAVSNVEGGDGSDIGAFELQPAPPPPGSPILVPAVRGDTEPAGRGDTDPPNTRIVSGPSRVTFERRAKFRFASTEAQSSFRCKVDRRPWRGCRNPFKRTVGAGVKAGRKHVLKVRAIDRFGNVDPTPARFGWRVKRIAG